MRPLVFVTHSPGKLAEVERILGYSVDHSPLDLAEIQAVEVEDGVIFKAQQAYAALQTRVMIEDTGLFIEAWNGLPGALIRWFLQYLGPAGICHLLDQAPTRQAYAKTVFAIYDGQGAPVLYTGRVNGHIAKRPKGELGFGWDPIFIPAGETRTFAEMPPPDKDKYSMRRLALQALKHGLEETA